MTALLKYDAACRAIAECAAVDEVKDWRDKAEAMRVYSRQAKNLDMEILAAEIRLRAERRLGILLNDYKNKGGRPVEKIQEKTGDKSEPVLPPTLEQMGIDKRLSLRCQRIGGIAEQAFEVMVARMRQQITDRGSRFALAEISKEEKQDRRTTRERDLAEKQAALPAQKFGVIYADPEWRFEPYSRDSGMDRAADNHYPTSGTDAICARPVGNIAADDCVLFLWATVPMLPDALKVMSAWGFKYKSHCIWTKDKIGTGYWFRNAHELLLVGTKGNIPAPAPGTQLPSTIEGRVGKHSAKPECFAELIEQYFPTLPKIELNRRGPPRKGWSAWGNESEQSPGASLTEHADAKPEASPEPIETIDPQTGEINAGGSHEMNVSQDGVPDFLKRQKESA